MTYWFKANRPEYVYLVAGTVGGIFANSTRPAEFIYDNMLIHATVVHAAHQYGAKKLLYLGSSCIYPRDSAQPMTESELLTGALEPTNEAYAIAKIAGIKLCQAYRRQYGSNFISAMPTNLYGPNDNFDLQNSHVLPAMMRKFHDAKVSGTREVVIWGTGTPQREFLHVDDLADACVFLMGHYEGEGHVNVGTGEDLSIRELAETLRDIIYPEAVLTWDAVEARRHAAQAARRLAAPPPRLAPPDRSARGHRVDLRVVPRKPRDAPDVASSRCSGARCSVLRCSDPSARAPAPEHQHRHQHQSTQHPSTRAPGPVTKKGRTPAGPAFPLPTNCHR